jgi:hypothetical protein
MSRREEGQSVDSELLVHGYRRVGRLGNKRKKRRGRAASGKNGGTTGTASPKKGGSESKPQGDNYQGRSSQEPQAEEG